VQMLLRDLNAAYRSIPALHEVDFSGDGFEWIDHDDNDNSVLSWLRKDKHGGYVVCISNLTPVARPDFRLGVPERRRFVEAINTDDAGYGGSGVRNNEMRSEAQECHGRSWSVALHLPPLASLILKPID